MKTFYDELTERGLVDTLYGTTFKVVVPKGGKQFAMLIKRIIDNNLRVYIDPDCDIDGYLAGLQLKTLFDAIGFNNYFIPMHSYKRHGVTVDMLSKYLNQDEFDVYFITDSSSANKDLFDYFLTRPELTMCLVDHHEVNFSRDVYSNTNVLLINPKWDSNEKGTTALTHEMSATAVLSLLIEFTVKTQFPEYHNNLDNRHWVYGYVSLYSDCCKLNAYNIAYVRKVLLGNYNVPPLLKLFMNKYNSLNRTFVEWTMNPRLNAILRDEYYKLAYDLFYNTSTIDTEVIGQIEEIYKTSKLFVQSLANSATIEEHDKFVLGYLKSEPRSRNYTGLVASNLATKYNKPCVILMQVSNNSYEGSVRDLYNRDLLSIFNLVMNANGHPPAFGVSIQQDELSFALNMLDTLLNSIQNTVTNSCIMVDWSMYSSRDTQLVNDIQLMVEYNEYSGNGLPVAFAKISLNHAMDIRRFPNLTRIKWGSMEFISFDVPVFIGDEVVLQPSYPKTLVVKFAQRDN